MLDLPREQTTTEILLRQSLDALAKLLALANAENRVLRDKLKRTAIEIARLRKAIADARNHLAKGRALWNGPCHQCDSVLERAIREGDGFSINECSPPYAEQGPYQTAPKGEL